MRFTNMRFPLAACAFAVLLSACGGGDATAPGSSKPGTSGFVVDGYLSGATVTCDSNGNGTKDTGEASTTTDSSGFFNLSSPCTSALIATGGISIDTQLPFTGTLKAPAGATVITPLTTLIASGISESALKTALGLSTTKTLVLTDPALTQSGSTELVDADLMKKTLVLQQFAQKVTEVVAGLATGSADKASIYTDVMAALAQALAANPSLITGAAISESSAQALIKAAVQRVAASTTLPAGVNAGVAALNPDSLAQVMAGALKAQGEMILGATGETLTAKTKAAQESTTITTFVQANRTNAALTGAPSAATAVLATNLKNEVAGTTTPPVANNLVANGDFSSGATGWSGNALQVRTEGGNSFNFADVAVAGEPYAVNLSYVLNIPNSGVGYKLRFKASSNRARTMFAGIGLNQDPFTNVGQTVNLTTVQQTFELRLTSTFASPTSRVIFDMGAATGNVVIDDVELTLDAPPAATNLVANGNFSNGITGWSGNARDVRTEGGNSFNFADVAVAGEPFAVNLSYVVNIPTSGVAYKLRFKASSNRARTMFAGIGLNQDPFTNVGQTVNLTTTQQTFELSLTSNFANASSRVIFDMGADTGVVVIDDVELMLDTSTPPPPVVGGPTAAASAPTALAANVISIFSDSYTNVAGATFGPDFGPSSSRITDGVIASNNFKTIDVTAGKTFGAVSFVSNKFNATAFTTLHMDYWIDTPIPVGQVLSIKLSNHDGVGETSAIQTTVVNITGGSWQRLAIPLSTFTQAANSLSRNNIAEIIITAARADLGVPVKVHFDNMYFSQPAPAPVATNLVANGNFSNGITGWSGNARDVRTEGGNSFNFADVAVAGEPFAVNLSYVVNIPTSGVAYKLRFKASSNRNRTMFAGIGLNQGPFTNVGQTVNLTTTQQTFELSLISNFASSTSRVIFDMGADTGQVVIDDVELVLDTSVVPTPAGGPTAAAAVPTALAANVVSIFSDSYTSLNVNSYGPDFGPSSARIIDGVIAGNNYKTIDMAAANQEFGAISFTSSKFNATAYTTFHMDYWMDAPLQAGQVLNIKLSNHDGAGETNAIQYLVNPPTVGGWQRLSIPLSSFTVAGGGSMSRNNIAEIIIVAPRAAPGLPLKVYFDNLYFSR